jgi:hypothetical protein
MLGDIDRLQTANKNINSKDFLLHQLLVLYLIRLRKVLSAAFC